MNISRIIKEISEKKIIILIFILGIVLRLVRSGAESLDFDEIYSVKLASMDLRGIIQQTSTDFHPPLYYFLLHLWRSFLGDSEFSVRLLSVLFGIMGIWGIYQLSKLLFNITTALVASFFFSISHLNIEFSQEARMYSLLVLLTIYSMYYLVKLEKEQSLINFVFFIIFNVLLLYTHVYSFFIISAEYFYILSLKILKKEEFNRCSKWFLHSAIVISLLFAPWIFVFYKQFLLAQKILWIPEASIWGFPESLVEYSGSFILSLVMVPLFLLSFFTIKVKSNEKKNKLLQMFGSLEVILSFSKVKEVYFLLIWLLFPVILPFIISQFLSPIFLVKYTIEASSAFILLAAYGFAKIKISGIKYSLLIVIGILSFLTIRNDWTVSTKERWKEAIGYLDSTARSSDLIVFNAGVCNYLYDYYSKRKDIKLLSFEPSADQLNRDSLKVLLYPYISKYNRIWLVVSHTRDYRGEISKTMKELSDSVSVKFYFTKNRKYFFKANFDNNSFDLYLLKSYVSPDISIYFYEKRDDSIFALKRGNSEKNPKLNWK
jgi:hypothetical protein